MPVTAIAKPRPIDAIRTYANQGGTNMASVLVPAGGHDSVLTVFNPSGVQIAANDDANGGGVNPLDSYIGPRAPAPPCSRRFPPGNLHRPPEHVFGELAQRCAFAMDISATGIAEQYGPPQLPDRRHDHPDDRRLTSILERHADHRQR